jgi:hypothetical protein
MGDLNQHMDALDAAGSGGALVRTLENLSSAIATGLRKSDSASRARFQPTEKPSNKTSGGNAEFVPSNKEVPANATEWKEKEVAKRGKAQTSMGGNPEAKRAVPESEGELGYDKLDLSEEEEEGKARIKRARQKAKAKVPANPVSSFKSWALGKGGVPVPDDGDDEEPEEAEDEDEDYGEEPDYDDDEDGDGIPDDEDPRDAASQFDPRAIAVLEALQDNPQVLAMLEQALGMGGGVAAGAGGPGMSASGGPGMEMGGGAPPAAPAGIGAGSPPPPPAMAAPAGQDDPRMLQRAMYYADELEKGFVNDPRAQNYAQAIEASQPLEMLTDQMVNGFARSLAGQDLMEQMLKAMIRRVDRIEKMVEAVGDAALAMGKSLAEQQELTKSITNQVATNPHPGWVYGNVAQQQVATDAPRAEIAINREVLANTIEAALEKSQDSTEARLLAEALVHVPSNPRRTIDLLPDGVLETYKKSLSA